MQESVEALGRGEIHSVDVDDYKTLALWSLATFGIAPIRNKATLKWLKSEMGDAVEVSEPVWDDYMNQHWVARLKRPLVLTKAKVRWDDAVAFRYSVSFFVADNGGR